ncbi:MAG: 2'-5' RNA ligase family protein, partial [Candidatus Dormibacteria bacterium]
KLPFDGRRFRAHCTLARITGNLSRAALGEIRSLLAADLAGGQFEVSEVCLLESRAVAGEPNRYTVRATLQFGPAVAHISNGRPYQG